MKQTWDGINPQGGQTGCCLHTLCCWSPDGPFKALSYDPYSLIKQVMIVIKEDGLDRWLNKAPMEIIWKVFLANCSIFNAPGHYYESLFRPKACFY